MNTKDAAIVVLDHSFRINSRVLAEASHSGLKLFIIYYSPYYHSEKLRSIYRDPRSNTELHRIALGSLSEDIHKLGGEVNLVLSGDPSEHLTQLAKDNPRVGAVYWDIPLFSPTWVPNDEELEALSVKVLPVCSDRFNPDISRRTAKSLSYTWAGTQNEVEHSICKDVKFVKLDVDSATCPYSHADGLTYQNIRDHLVDCSLRNIHNRAGDYLRTRNAYGGSCEASCLLQHGMLDAPSIIHKLLQSQEFDVAFPLLRQFAFRELAIKKARRHGLNMQSSLDDWVDALMTDKSACNIRDNEFEPECTVEEFQSGNTPDVALNYVILRAKNDRWMPNRARMWLAGEAYHMLGGGLKSLQALVDFFDFFIDDGQSPNNYINCISALSLSYGRVVRLNREKAIKLLELERVMEEGSVRY